MQIVRLESLAPRGWSSPAVSVGNFDGVHLGHQALAEAVVREARAAGGSAIVLTFDPHPARVLAPERAPGTLLTITQRAELLGQLGIERLAVLPFTPELSQYPPEGFARRVLAECLGARAVVVGANFRFGRSRAGDLAALTAFGAALGFRVAGLPPLLLDGAPISSTRVREAVARGDCAAARELLGRRHFLDGTVVGGVARGRTLGLATANLDPLNETLPHAGVYACCARVLPERLALPAVVNVGRRPTFGGGALLVEAHLIDFEGDLYGRQLRLEFEARLRDERSFDGPGALVAQVQQDIASARRLLEKAC
jgi:riboflavin kinase/FMN adenylyltransferase